MTKLINAKDLTMNVGLPNMMEVLGGLMQAMIFVIVDKQQVQGYTQERERKYKTHAVRIPFTAQQLRILPEGQRSWKWETIYSYPDLVLTIDDRIKFNKIYYRVMEKTDYSEYGYVQYNIAEDFNSVSEA